MRRSTVPKQEVGVNLHYAVNISPHVLRHTLATNLLKNGCSLPFIQQQLRHKPIETTMVYLHTDKEMLKSAYERHKPNF